MLNLIWLFNPNFAFQSCRTPPDCNYTFLYLSIMGTPCYMLIYNYLRLSETLPHESFQDIEYFVGITPGYIAGQSSSKHETTWGSSFQYWENTWTEKKNAFSLTLDAGLTLNYSIWRFDLKLTPAFHYNLINSLAYQSSRGEKGVGVTSTDTQPLRWFFTLSGGLAFRF